MSLRMRVELLLLQGTILLVLESAVEGAEALNLYLLRLQQHLNETAAELLQYAVNDIGGVDTSVLRDVVSQLSGVQCFQTLDLSVPLAEGRAVRVLVLLYFIQNLCHTLKCVFV